MKIDPSPVQPQLNFTGDSQPPPKPLPEELPPVMPFSEDLLPAAVAPWVMDTWERMQCPPDYPAVAAMVAVAGVVGRQIAVGPQAETDWLVVPNLWGLLVWPDVSTNWREIDRPPHELARQQARQIFRRLSRLNPVTVGATLQEDGPSLLRFDPDALDHFRH